MYFRHLSIKYRSILSADMATDDRSIYPLICQPRLDRVSVDMLFKLIERWSTLSVGMSADTRPICWDRQSLVYQSTVGGVMYQSTIEGIGIVLTVVLLKY